MKRYIRPFVDVSMNVFKKFLNCEVSALRPYITGARAISDWDISGIINLSGDANGMVVVSMQRDLAVRLTGLLAGPGHTIAEEEVADAIGEVINIIAGNAKRSFADNFHLYLSLPQVLQSRNQSVEWPKNTSRILCIPFQVFGNDVFCLSVSIEVLKEV
jgi:chemotaxis protein CheX